MHIYVFCSETETINEKASMCILRHADALGIA